MENKVGNNVLTKEGLEDLKGRIRAILTEMKQYGVLLSSTDRTRLSRPRGGSEPYVLQMTEVVSKHSLEKKSAPIEGMKSDLEVVKQFESLRVLFEEGVQISEDTTGQAKSEYWEAFLLYHGMIQGMVSRDPELANDVKEIEAFMALGPRRK